MSIESERRRLKARTDKPPLPVGTYVEAAPFLRAPFTPDAVRFKVWESWSGEGGDSLTHATVVPYIDVRTVFARLNTVCPDLWSEDPPSREGGHLWAGITMHEPQHGDEDGTWIQERTITRRDIGDTYNGKGLVSDAFKRAAVHFGVGESLYAVPTIELTTTDPIDQDDDEGPLLRVWAEWDDGKLKPTLRLTRAGEEYARDIYRRWLLAYGIAAFGRPLDHGNLTAPPEMELTGPPMPTTAKRKAPERQPAAATATHATGGNIDTITPDASPEDKLAVLLAVKDEGDKVRMLRAACNGVMERAGGDAAFRLSQLLQAAKDRKGVEVGLGKLLKSLENATGQTDDTERSEP